MTNSKEADKAPDIVADANEAARNQVAALDAPDGKTVKVRTVFGHEVEVDPVEAANLRRHGLDADSKPNIGRGSNK